MSGQTSFMKTLSIYAGVKDKDKSRNLKDNLASTKKISWRKTWLNKSYISLYIGKEWENSPKKISGQQYTPKT